MRVVQGTIAAEERLAWLGDRLAADGSITIADAAAALDAAYPERAALDDQHAALHDEDVTAGAQAAATLSGAAISAAEAAGAAAAAEVAGSTRSAPTAESAVAANIKGEGIVTFGHAAFLGFGTYIGQKVLSAGVPVPIAVLTVAAFGAVISLALGIPSLRLRGVYLTLVTLAFGAT